MSSPHEEEMKVLDFWREVCQKFRANKTAFVNIIVKASKGKLDKKDAEHVFDELVKAMT